MSKGYIVLDLDQTLISAEPTEEYDFSANKNKAKKFVFHDMDGYYVIFERPGLQPFLSYLFDNFNVSIWTAASKDYALFIIDKIILAGNSNRKINYIFFSYHCDISESYKNGTKDLSLLWDTFKLTEFSKDNTFILDDYDEVHKTQPGNCIIAVPFEFSKDGSEGDNFLEKLIPKIRLLNEKVKSGSSVVPSVEEINKDEIAKGGSQPKRRKGRRKSKK
jgi:TFIIF-interacting CTD phosphatase-like protein